MERFIFRFVSVCVQAASLSLPAREGPLGPAQSGEARCNHALLGNEVIFPTSGGVEFGDNVGAGTIRLRWA